MSFGNPQILSSAGSSLQPTPPGPTPSPAGSSTLTVALQNGTPNFGPVATAPNDGKPHVCLVTANLVVTTLEVGGTCQLQTTRAGISGIATALFAAGQAAGTYGAGSIVLMDPGASLFVVQISALTGGAATLSVLAYII